jgi:hypothetical protein
MTDRRPRRTPKRDSRQAGLSSIGSVRVQMGKKGIGMGMKRFAMTGIELVVGPIHLRHARIALKPSTMASEEIPVKRV